MVKILTPITLLTLEKEGKKQASKTKMLFLNELHVLCQKIVLRIKLFQVENHLNGKSDEI